MHVPILVFDRVPLSGWFMKQNVKRRIRNPADVLSGDPGGGVVLVLEGGAGTADRRFIDRIIAVAAPDGLPIAGLELKPVMLTGSGVLPLVVGAVEHLGFL
jgi:hypothetical protein